MSERSLRVHCLPRLVPDQELAGSTVVVVDLLRASTTICQALASGAREVVPLVHVSEALEAARGADRLEIVLGGERGGRPIDGFDLGNSPSEYTREAVAGRRVLFTTTNGSRALWHARLAERVLVGAIVNLSAVVASVKDCPRVDVLCAGTDGNEIREDILAAGAIVHQLCATAAGESHLNDHAIAARQAWDELLTAAHAAKRAPSDQLAHELRDTQGGRNLLAIDLEGDLADCAQIDALRVVPELDTREWRIFLP